MTENVRIRIISVLLKTLYKQNLISEDVYHHSLDNLPEMPEQDRESGYGAAGREANPDGCV